MLTLLILAVLQFISAGLADHGSRVVCYYAGWAGQRRPPYAVFPRDLPPDLCTHVIFSAAVPSLETGIAPADPPQLSLNGYREAVSLKSLSKQGLKVLLSLEAIEDGARSFSQLVEDSQVRGALARGAVALLRALKMDGLDINWQFPGLRSSKDPENFVAFVKEMREEMNREGLESGREPLLLTLSVPPIEGLVRLGFQLENLNQYVDWFNVLAMDYHTSNEKETAHPSPLYSLPGDVPNAHLNVDSTVKFYLSQGVEPKKVVVGIPLYGRTFLLQTAFQTQLGAPARTRSTRRQHIKDTLALYELCRFVEKGGGWTTERPNATAMGPYSFYADVWVAYDDIDMVTKKAEYVKSHGLGGLAFWTVDQDDVLGECGPRYATVATARAALSEDAPVTEKPHAPALYPPSTEPSWQENSVSPPGERPAPDPILVGQGQGRPAISDVEGISVQPTKEEAPQTFGPSSSSAILPPFTPIPDDLPEPTPTQEHDPDTLWGPRKNISEKQETHTPSPPELHQEQTTSTYIYTGYAPYAPNIPFVFEEPLTEAPVDVKPVTGDIPYNPDSLWGPRKNVSSVEHEAGVPFTPDHLWGPRENISSEFSTPVEGDVPYTPDHLWGPRENISHSQEDQDLNSQLNETLDFHTSNPLNHYGHQSNLSNEVAPSYGNKPFSPDNLWGPRENISTIEEEVQQPQKVTEPTKVPENVGDFVSTLKPSRGNTVYSGTRRPTKGDRGREGTLKDSSEDYFDTKYTPDDNESNFYTGQQATDGNDKFDAKKKTKADDFDAGQQRQPTADDNSDAGQQRQPTADGNSDEGQQTKPITVDGNLDAGQQVTSSDPDNFYDSDDEPKWISALNRVLSQIPVTLNGTLKKPGHSKSDFNIVSNIKPITSLLGHRIGDDQWDAKGEASNTDDISESNISIQEQFPDNGNDLPLLGRVLLNNSRDVYLQTVHIHVTNHFYYNMSEATPAN